MRNVKKIFPHLTLSKVLLVLLVLLIGVQLTVLFLLQDPVVGTESPSKALESYAQKMIAKCKDAKYRPTCYDVQIPKLMDTLSMEEAFTVTTIVQDLDPTYSYCHVVGHKLSAREVAKDPSKWKDVVTRCPRGVCSNGCIHGGFQEKFRKQMFSDSDIEKYTPDLSGICEARGDWKPTGVEQASCYHAVGHLTMYVTNGEIQKALPLCDVISKKEGGRDYTMLCYDGAFMQIFQPLEFDDFSLVEGKQPTKETVFSYCAGFTLAQQASCINESWPLFRDEIMTPQGFYAHCAKSPTEYGKKYCYTALAYIITPKLQFDPERTSEFCKVLPSDASLVCLRNAATRMIETDTRNIPKAISLCSLATTEIAKDACFGELAKRSSYYLGENSAAKEDLCQKLPSKWRSRCE
ncbi:MAG: hypothetical protein RLZZ455_323 [Candidatus Parcubacteria bacterium]